MKRYTADELHGDLYYTLPDDAEYYSRADLIAAGCIVPVPVGEPYALGDMPNGQLFIGGPRREIFVQTNNFEGDTFSCDGKRRHGNFTRTMTLQPVRLVKLEDAK